MAHLASVHNNGRLPIILHPQSTLFAYNYM